MNKDRLVGAGKQVVGSAKQIVGKLVGDAKLQNAAGSVKDTLRR
jgi:uncharacterized protein YjbJ (UPF0337 family)